MFCHIPGHESMFVCCILATVWHRHANGKRIKNRIWPGRFGRSAMYTRAFHAIHRI
jgi:hypothetical protein